MTCPETCRCISCRMAGMAGAKALRDRRYRERNKAKIASKDKRYQAANRERIKARKRAYYLRNRESILAKCRLRDRRKAA